MLQVLKFIRYLSDKVGLINRPTFSGKTEENNRVLGPWIAHLSAGIFVPVVK